jgi:quercetin dioxygenase-like cupin family protein
MAGNPDRVRVLADEEGELLWFLGGLVVVKADSQLTEGHASLVDQRLPPGFAPPRHVHRDEDEIFYVLEGEVSVLADGRSRRAERGAFIFLPKGVEHSFLTGSNGARMLTFTTPGSFADFVRSASQQATEYALPPPPPGPPSEEQQRMLVEAAARFNIEITGPPITADDVRASERPPT